MVASRRDPPTEEEVWSWFDSLSNWGRWGDDDEAGTLNYITPAVRVAAVAEVIEGVTVSCAWPVLMNVHRENDRATPLRLMEITGEGLTPERLARNGRIATAIEWVGLQFHGHNITHVDALSHGSLDARMFNGFPAHRVTATRGATRLAVTAASDALVTRGVLLDMTGVRDKEWLDSGEGVFPADLEEAEERQGVRVREGDFVLLHTGHSVRVAREGIVPVGEGWPGWHAACLPWLHERKVAAIGADLANDVLPSGYDHITHPIHAVGLVAMGLWLLDNVNTAVLAEACSTRGRWSFLLSCAVLPLDGATGSPVNPIALF